MKNKQLKSNGYCLSDMQDSIKEFNINVCITQRREEREWAREIDEESIVENLQIL